MRDPQPRCGRPLRLIRCSGAAAYVAISALPTEAATAVAPRKPRLPRKVRLPRQGPGGGRGGGGAPYNADRVRLIARLSESQKAAKARSRTGQLAPVEVTETVRELLTHDVGIREYMLCLNALGRSQLWEESINLLSHMGDQADEFVFNKLISTASSSMQGAQAEGLLQEMWARGLSADVRACNTAVGALAKSGAWERVLGVLASMQGRRLGMDTVTCNSAISACAKSGKWEQALQLLQDADRPDVITYTAMVNACKEAGLWQLSLHLVDAMWQGGLAPNERTYAAAIMACVSGDEPRQSLTLFDEMSKRRVQPNTITYDAVIRACHEDRELWPVALSCLSNMRASGVHPDTGIYNGVMQSCINAFDWGVGLEAQHSMVEKLLQDMLDAGIQPNDATYFNAMSACAKAAQWERALGLLGEMQARRLTPGSFNYNVAISACKDSLQWECALHLLSEMPRKGVTPNDVHFTTAISACEKASSWEWALELAEEMGRRDLHPNVITYTVLICAYSRAGLWSQAMGMLGEMQRRGKDPNELTYSAAIGACQAAKQWELGLHWKAEMENRGLEPHFTTYVYLVAACAEAEQWDWVASLMAEIRSKFSDDRSFKILDIYAVALLGCARGADGSRQAMRLAQEMLESGYRANAACCSAALSACARSMDWEEFYHGWVRCGGVYWFDDVRRSTKAITAALSHRGDLLSRAEALGAATLGLDELRWLGLAEPGLEGAFREQILRPAVSLLASAERPATGRGATLGSLFGREALEALELLPGRGDSSWLPKARRTARRAAHSSPLLEEDEAGGVEGEGSSWRSPSSSSAPVWVASHSRRGAAGAAGPAGCRGRAGLDSAGGCGEWRWPASVGPALDPAGSSRGHSPPALETAIEALELREADLEPRGAVRLYSSYAPCLSCLAAYAQFKARFPGVKLRVAFDDLRESARWAAGLASSRAAAAAG